MVQKAHFGNCCLPQFRRGRAGLLNTFDCIGRMRSNRHVELASFPRPTTPEKLLALWRGLHLRPSTRAGKMLVRCIASGFAEQRRG
jgi:hypothetical protein